MQTLNMQWKVVVTGPESTGKTFLAQSLAHHFDCPCVPEFARPYLQALIRPYSHADLKDIASGQQAWINWYAKANQKGMLICDTDWSVIHVWELFVFGKIKYSLLPPPWDRTYYLLCAPDIPWEPDPLREHPQAREALFEHYHHLLQQMNLPFTIISGDFQSRFENSKRIIDQLL
ncbi:MAG: ATP-binding protein [Saprospiraceae bacterium]|nr:ATP-binding protein [Saprospiraceae bacterium]